MVVFLHIEARVGSGSHLGDGAALSRDSTAPPMGEGSRKGDLKKSLSHLYPVSIPQLTGHLPMRSKQTKEKK